MALYDYYEHVDCALEKLSDALDLLEQVPVIEIEREKVGKFEELFEVLDKVAEELEKLVEDVEEREEPEEEEDAVEGEFKEVE